MHQDRKVVYSVGSEMHHATEQLVFMADPNDPTFTVRGALLARLIR